MPKIKYDNNVNPPEYVLLKEGIYVFRVIDAKEGYQTAGATKGAEFLELKVGIEDGNGRVVTSWFQKLIFHEKTQWFVKGFIKASNVAGDVHEGQDVELDPDVVVGLRGYCYVYQDTFEGNKLDENGKPKMVTVNKIKHWVFDRGRLEPVEEQEEYCPF